MKKLLFLLLFSASTSGYGQIITRITGFGSALGDGGPAIEGSVNTPYDVTTDRLGNIYIADRNNSRIRRIDPSGIITTIAGNGTVGFSGDGGPAVDAVLGRPTSVAVDSLGNIYFLDRDNNRIRKINPAGIITTIAGNGVQSYVVGNGPALSSPLGDGFGIAADWQGNVYIAEFGAKVIRRVGTDGMITIVAGNGTIGNMGDGGPALEAQLNNPNWIGVDRAGNLYVSDMTGNRVRKVDTNGIITHFAGNQFGSPGFGGDGGPATQALMDGPADVEIDRLGNVYIVSGDRIRRVDAISGIITTYAGNGTLGWGGDGGLAIYANIGGRAGIGVDNDLNLYLAESYGGTIRKVTSGNLGLTDNKFETTELSLYPNPSSGQLVIESNTTGTQQLRITDVNGNVLLSKEVNGTTNAIDLAQLSDGVYIVSLLTAESVQTTRLVLKR